jgi:hypothetical protein
MWATDHSIQASVPFRLKPPKSAIAALRPMVAKLP